LGHRDGEFPESEKAARTTLAMPMFPELTVAQRERVVHTISGYYEGIGAGPLRRAA
jgi:dTDP-4-amino-4,6-dideoxygalactose transaminase